MKALLVAVALLLTTSVAWSQHNHAAGHNLYQGWASKKTGNCCNNDDCGELKKADWRYNEEGTTEIQVLGEWCPVLPIHYVIRGKSPNAEVPHVCVDRKTSSSRKGCDRLLCFMGNGGT